MLLETLQTRYKIILSETKNHKFVIYPSNQEEVELLTDYKISDSKDKCDYLDLLDMCGHVNEVQHTHVKDIIFEHKKHKEESFDWHGRKNTEIKIEYTCYQPSKKAPNNNVICHEDKVSSFKCACELLQTKYFIVLKEKISWMKEQEDLALTQMNKDAEDLFCMTHKETNGDNSNNNNS